MEIALTRLDPRGYRLTVLSNSAPVSWNALIAALLDDAALREALAAALVSVPFEAVFWEARPVTREDADAGFESVLLDAPALARVRADVRSFLDPLAGARAPAVKAFSNLSGDASLIVPAPDIDAAGYPHLLAFLRRAPREQVHALWRELAHSLRERLDGGGARVWVSTAGLGVPWLHVRLDSRPKYVQWRAYREWGGARSAG